MDDVRAGSSPAAPTQCQSLFDTRSLYSAGKSSKDKSKDDVNYLGGNYLYTLQHCSTDLLAVVIFALLAQLEEAVDLGSTQCRFESYKGYNFAPSTSGLSHLTHRPSLKENSSRERKEQGQYLW